MSKKNYNGLEEIIEETNKEEEKKIEAIKEEVKKEVKKEENNFVKVFNSSNRNFIFRKNEILKAQEIKNISKDDYEKIKNFKEVKVIK